MKNIAIQIGEIIVHLIGGTSYHHYWTHCFNGMDTLSALITAYIRSKNLNIRV